MVKAMVVFSMALAVPETMGITFSKMLSKSQEWPRTNLRGPDMEVERQPNMAWMVGEISPRKRSDFSTAAMNLPKRTSGVPFPGVEACPPLERAMNFRSAQPFSPTPTMAKVPLDPPMGSVKIMPPSSRTMENRMPRDSRT